jgi:hypothetical protein
LITILQIEKERKTLEKERKRLEKQRKKLEKLKEKSISVSESEERSHLSKLAIMFRDNISLTPSDEEESSNDNFVYWNEQRMFRGSNEIITEDSE